MQKLKVGLFYKDKTIVEPGQTASLLNPDLPEALATASLVSFVQLAAAKAVAPYLEPDQFTGGTKIGLAQLASTPVGMEISAAVQLERLEGRRLGFVLEVYDEFEKICEGTHERYIIGIDWFKTKVEEKLKLVKAG
ncbi:MAG: thioesterase family protein [Candidatus Methylomirabilales bacterium]